jgi:hypothetical protein
MRMKFKATIRYGKEMRDTPTLPSTSSIQKNEEKDYSKMRPVEPMALKDGRWGGAVVL